MSKQLEIRSLERDDLQFVHQLNNNPEIMSYWFEEPYEAFVELQSLYDKHIHDQSERRFVVEKDDVKVGIVELVEIDYIHRNTEFQIIIDPAFQGKGYAKIATKLALDYAFRVLNMHKVYLIVDTTNKGAIHVYEKAGFVREAELIEEFFVEGTYHDALRMYMLQHDYLNAKKESGHDS